MGWIYIIVNLVNWKVYIGKWTGKYIKQRLSIYRRANSHNKHLNSAIKHYGLDNFCFGVMHENVPLGTLSDVEIAEIARFDCNECRSGWGYNQTDGGDRGALGYKKTPEQIAKTSGENHGMFGKNLSPNHIAAISGENHYLYGKGHLVAGEKNGMFRNGHLISGEKNPMFGITGEKHPSFGTPRTEEEKAKISEGRKGKHAGEKHHMYGRKGERHPNFGIKRTSEQIAKTSGEKNGMFRNGHLISGENHGMFGKRLTPEVKAKIASSKRNPVYMQARCFFFICVVPMEIDIREKRKQLYAEFPDVTQDTIRSWVRKWHVELES